MKKKHLIEVCVAHLKSAIAAQKGGAKRVELCDNLYEGGTTPSYATIKMTREKLDIGLNVMIRPRGSDFYYSDLEFEMMKEDIRICKELGADGVVFGILLPDGKVDLERNKLLIELSRPMNVTFHRAFDATIDPFQALESIIELGFSRILTSGQKNTVPEGLELLKQLVEKANSRIIIMPGSGISENNIKEVRDFTGAKEFHLTGRRVIQSKMQYRKEGIFFGGLPQIPEYEMKFTDPDIISNVVSLVNNKTDN